MEKRFAFTVNRIDRLEPQEKRYFVYDDNQPGLRLYVTPSGSKTFQFQQRSKKLNKIVTETMGKYPALSIKEAREQAANLLSDVNTGADIEQVKRNLKRKKLLDPTVEAFSTEFIEKYSMLKKKSWQEDQRILNVDVIPYIGKLHMTEVKKRDIVAVLDKVQDRGKMVMCNRVHAVLSKMFGFAIERDVIESFPMYGVKKRGKEVPRDRILSDQEIKQLWAALGDTSVSMLIKFLLVTGQRTGETRQMLFSEIVDETWTIPGEKTKNGLIHDVPLSSMATEIIEKMRSISKGPYVFPAKIRNHTFGKQCLDKDAAPKHLRKLVNKLGWDRSTPHDLRRTMRSNLSKLKVRKTVAEQVLNHKQAGVVGVYDRYEYFDEKKSALVRWADHLNAIITGKSVALAVNIVPFDRKSANE